MCFSVLLFFKVLTPTLLLHMLFFIYKPFSVSDIHLSDVHNCLERRISLRLFRKMLAQDGWGCTLSFYPIIHHGIEPS